jgi:hypothetical protein
VYLIYVLFFQRRKKRTKRTPLKERKVSKIKRASYFDFFNISPSLRIHPHCSLRELFRLSVWETDLPHPCLPHGSQVRGIFKGERMSVNQTRFDLQTLALLNGVSLVRFLPTRARNEHKNN